MNALHPVSAFLSSRCNLAGVFARPRSPVHTVVIKQDYFNRDDYLIPAVISATSWVIWWLEVAACRPSGPPDPTPPHRPRDDPQRAGWFLNRRAPSWSPPERGDLVTRLLPIGSPWRSHNVSPISPAFITLPARFVFWFGRRRRAAGVLLAFVPPGLHASRLRS